MIKDTKLGWNPNQKQAQALRSLQSIPEIILPSGRKLGPLQKDQIVEMEAGDEDAKFLIDGALCATI
jgi:hypothetical protein